MAAVAADPALGFGARFVVCPFSHVSPTNQGVSVLPILETLNPLALYWRIVMSDRYGNPVTFEDPIGFLPRALTKLYSAWVRLTYPFAAIGRKVSIHYTCRLKRPTAHLVKLGNSVIFGKDAWLVVSIMKAMKEPAIVIDDSVIINDRVQISATNSIHIERDVIISAAVLIQDHNHGYEDVTKPVREQPITEGGRIRIEQGSFVGRGAAIICTKGELVVGRNCVIAANAVVLRSCPPYSVVFGNPARVVRRYDFAKEMWVLGSGAPEEVSIEQ